MFTLNNFSKRKLQFEIVSEKKKIIINKVTGIRDKGRVVISHQQRKKK